MSITGIHAQIQGFLQAASVVSRVSAEDYAQEARFTKAGVVPFLRGEPYRFYVMKPQAKIASLGAPPFQLCKGTRMHNMPGLGWRDIKESKERAPQAETLAQTALREGMEELGLVLGAIRRLVELGPYGFSSATTGKGKEMWLFAAEMQGEGGFLPAAGIAASTQDRRWVSADEFDVVGREDHRYILRDIEHKLKSAKPE